MQAAPRELMMLRSRLVADHGGDFEHHLFVEARGKSDGLREHRRGAGTRYAMQRLVPPLIRRNAQPGDCRRVVAQLSDLLFQRHARHQVCRALLERFIEVAIHRLGTEGRRGEPRKDGQPDGEADGELESR
jgi:hypothetical protein